MRYPEPGPSPRSPWRAGKRLSHRVTVLAVLALSGCASEPSVSPMSLIRPKPDQARSVFDRDGYECVKDAQVYAAPGNAELWWVVCMQSKGYELAR